MNEPEVKANIRELLGHFIGQRVLEITQNEVVDFDPRKQDHFVELMFENGCTLKFFITDSEHYKSGAPFCFSDGKEVDDEWVPTKEECESRGWICIAWRDGDGRVDHVIPTFGQNHRLIPECWCGPLREVRDDESYFYTHNASEPQ
jgi:hypothetical protein